MGNDLASAIGLTYFVQKNRVHFNHGDNHEHQNLA